MTKDLALLVKNCSPKDLPRESWLNTFDFLDKIAENLNKALAK